MNSWRAFRTDIRYYVFIKHIESRYLSNSVHGQVTIYYLNVWSKLEERNTKLLVLRGVKVEFCPSRSLYVI